MSDRVDKTEFKGNGIKSTTVENDGTRWSFISSMNPKTFGDMEFKLQNNEQPHDETSYWDI